MRRKTVAMAAAVIVMAAMVTVPASAGVPAAHWPAAAVRSAGDAPDSGCPDVPRDRPTGPAAQIQTVCFTKTLPPGVTVKRQPKPPGVGTNQAVDCGFETWVFNRLNTCMREHGFLTHVTQICEGGFCRFVPTGWVEVDVTYHSTTFPFNPEWVLRTTVTAVAADGTGHDGVVLSAVHGCVGSCFVEVNDFPPQHIRVGDTASGEGWFRSNISGPNQRRYGNANVLITFNKPGGDFPGQHLQPVGTETRCDSTESPTGCVFWIFTPVFALDRDWHNEAAEHVDKAQKSGLVGKDWPLTRTTNQAKINANRAASCGNAPSLPGRSCDEYPFASTNEGAARFGSKAGRTFDDCHMDLPQGVTGASGWSACMINEVDNSSAGADLGVFYENNRVINLDEFFVAVD